MTLLEDFKNQIEIMEKEIGLKIHSDVALEAINDLVNEKIYDRFYQRYRDRLVPELLTLLKVHSIPEPKKIKTSNRGTFN